MVLFKRIIVLILLLISFSIILPIVQALQTQSLTSVEWEDLPANIEELTNYTLDIDFDFTSSSLQNYTIETSGVTILNIDNPNGCSITQNNIICPTNSEPSIAVQTNAIDNNSTISWIVYTNDATDGEEVWNLNFSITNTVNAPEIITSSLSNYSITKYNSIINYNFTFTESNYSIANASINYLSSNTEITNVRDQNTSQILLDCNESTNTCNTTLNISQLISESAEEYFFNSFIQIYD